MLEIGTSDIRVSRISGGYQRHNKRMSRENWSNFNEISDGFQQNVKKYLLDIPKYQPEISRQWSGSRKLEKSLKTAMF